MKYNSILLVDDSATSRMIMKRCFTIAGHSESKYFEASGGLDALSFLKENSVDLIITDLMMPEMDGKIFIKKVKSDQNLKDIPIIVVSSMGNNILENQLLEGGAFAIIRKPLSPAGIIEVLGENDV